MGIEKYLKESELRHYKNKLECICLLITGTEQTNGYYDHFISEIKKTSTCGKIISQQLDFKIVTTDNFNTEYGEIEKNFKSVDIIKIYVPKYIDVYYNTEQECIGNMPILGLKSGPNYVFFQALRELVKYNTTLFLECDVFLSEDWISNIDKYVESANGFWVSGSVYDGQNIDTIHDVLNSHINGGVGLYATGNTQFQKFMKFCYDHFPDYVNNKSSNLPYDFLIKMVIDDGFNQKDYYDNIWSFIRRQYHVNNHIFNYSTKKDAEINNEEIAKLYNYSIIHKKPYLEKYINTQNKHQKSGKTHDLLHKIE